MRDTAGPGATHVFRRSMINRADLVYWLRRDKISPMELEKAADLLGFEAKPEPPKVSQRPPETSPAPDRRQTAESQIDGAPPLEPDLCFFRVASRERLISDSEAPADQTIEPRSIQGLADFTPQELMPADVKPLKRQPLITWSRLWPVLKRRLHTSRQSGVDISSLIKYLAAGRTMRRIPRLQRLRWAAQIEVLLDDHPRLLPFQGDFDAVCEALQVLVGKFNLKAWKLGGKPGGECFSWEHPEQDPQPWNMPLPTTPVLILGDLGMLDRPGSASRRRWLSFGRQLHRAGILPFVLAPVSPGHVDPELCRYFHLTLWSTNSRLHRQRQRQDKERRAQIQQLLALLSPAVRIEPALLRAVRHLLPADQFDAGCEAEFWLHPDVQVSPLACAIRDEEVTLSRHREAFARQSERLQRRVIQLLRLHHASLFPAIRHEEILIWASLVPSSLAAEFRKEIDEAKRFMGKMANMLYRQRDNVDALQRDYGFRHLARSHTELRRQHLYYSVVEGIVNQEKLDDGIPVRAGIDRDELRRTLSADSQRRRLCTLYQQGQALMLAEKEPAAPADVQAGSRYAHLTLFGDDLFIEQRSEDGSPSERYLQLNELPKSLAQLSPAVEGIRLHSQTETITLGSVTKPTWASAMGRDQQGLFVEFEQRGAFWRVYWPEWGAHLGHDDYGLYADLTVKNTNQRFRWIEPGTFRMGSPEAEPQRTEDETPHQVTLTQGYWLADTACTQALWQAVIGDNPAEFVDDPNNPVEGVNWEDAQRFIETLNAFVPGLSACLPTEAQWEYACRAGTDTPFSFGANITPEHVNYNGNFPYANGKIGQFREKTVPVKSLPANPWGLYEMHGNVWEWCQDWYGDYSSDPGIEDPAGPPDGVFRALRGGSWYGVGGSARSAGRSWDLPGLRSGDFGFRLALGQAAFTRQAIGKQGAASAVAADGRSRSGAGRRLGREQPEGRRSGWWEHVKDWWNER